MTKDLLDLKEFTERWTIKARAHDDCLAADAQAREEQIVARLAMM